MTFSPQDAADLEMIAGWLAMERIADPGRLDAVVICGSEIVECADVVGLADRYVVSGGVGHGTPGLLARTGHPGPSEAAVFRSLLIDRGAPPDAINVEDRSTNCGENARFSLALLPGARRIGIAQDPTMMRRTVATFARLDPTLDLVPLPPFVPTVGPDGPVPRAWTTPERFVGLVLGEIPRLRPTGYGPDGADYIVRVEIPNEIEAAYARVSDLAGRR